MVPQSRLFIQRQPKLFQSVSSGKSLGSRAMSFMLKSVKSRQVGAVEAADRLLGHHLYSKSRQTRFADLQPAEQAKRVLKPASEIGLLLQNKPDSDDIFYPHWVLDVYPARPPTLDGLSVHHLLGWYEKERAGSVEAMFLPNLGYYFRRRASKPYIVTHQQVNVNQSAEDRERYYYFLLKLFKPWRTETELQIPGKNFQETFMEEVDRLPEMKRYHERNAKIVQRFS